MTAGPNGAPGEPVQAGAAHHGLELTQQPIDGPPLLTGQLHELAKLAAQPLYLAGCVR